MRVSRIGFLYLLLLACVGCVHSMWNLTCPTATPRNGGTIEDARLEIVQLSGDLDGAERQRAYAVNRPGSRFTESSPKIVRLDVAIKAAQGKERNLYDVLDIWDTGGARTREAMADVWKQERLPYRRTVADAVRASQRTMVSPDLRWDGQPTWSFWRWLRTGNGQGTLVVKAAKVQP